MNNVNKKHFFNKLIDHKNKRDPSMSINISRRVIENEEKRWDASTRNKIKEKLTVDGINWIWWERANPVTISGARSTHQEK